MKQALASAATRLPPPLRGLYLRFESLAHEFAKFGSVGAVAAVIDIGTFNLLRLGPLDEKVLTSKCVSTVIAATFAYFANRQWTWRYRGRRHMAHEYLLFFFFNAIGLFIAEACLGLSHYVLGFTDPLSDNISANGFGLVLGTIFRFWSYRRWVFPEAAKPVPAPAPGQSGATVGTAPSGATVGTAPSGATVGTAPSGTPDDPPPPPFATRTAS